jgi:hypothetical protein
MSTEAEDIVEAVTRQPVNTQQIFSIDNLGQYADSAVM